MADLIKIEGMKELDKRLGRLGAKTGGKALRKAVRLAAKPVLQEMRSAAPRGTKDHRTYKGRYAAPGFLSRNVVWASRYRQGRATISLGVRQEAFYGVQFLDEKGLTVTERKGKAIKPYRISPRRWFLSRFIRNTDRMVDAVAKELEKAIAEAIK